MPVTISRRWWVIVGAITVGALGIAATSGAFDGLQEPTGPGPTAAVTNTPGNERSTVSPTSDPSPTGGVPRRRGNEVVLLDGPDLVAVDPDTGASRTLLDFGAGTDALPTALGGEVIRGRINDAAWSSDGLWVAFDGPDAALWAINAEGIRRLASAVDGGWAWSPTDARLAMILDSTLILVDASTGRTIDLAEVAGDITHAPVWSPDGTRIVIGVRGGSFYSVDVRSGRRSLLVRVPGENLDSTDEIEWSPDGAHLAVMNDLEPGGGRLYVMNADGSRVRVLLDNYQPAGLAWSPDGESLAYATQGGGPPDRLWTISLLESLPFSVTSSTDIQDPVWSPDGTRIGFMGSTTDGFAGYAVDADGGGPLLEIDEPTYLSWRDGPVS